MLCHQAQVYAVLTNLLAIHNQLWQYAVKHPADMTIPPKPLMSNQNKKSQDCFAMLQISSFLTLV